jgi:hypothetical protein
VNTALQFLKKHYEKVILIAVLLALAVAAAWLPIAIRQARNDIESHPTIVPQGAVGVPTADLDDYRGRFARLDTPPKVLGAENHNLFNPVVWKMGGDGKLIKIETGEEEGMGALELLKITPLNLNVRFENVQHGQYTFTVSREASPNPALRRAQRVASSVGGRNALFTLKEIQGPADAPEAFVIEMNDSRETFRFTRDEPLRHPEAYSADLFYPPTKQTFPEIRVGGRPLIFAGDSYKVIAITENAVRVQANSNQKQRTITRKEAP